MIQVNDINEFLHHACSRIHLNGDRVNSRAGATYELHPAFYKIKYPKYRTLLYPTRGNNPFATLFETIWVLGAKDNDISLLSKFLPRAVDYSDDGKRWRAGYPERIRTYSNSCLCEVDQFKYVYDKLRKDINTRQAVINFWNPLKDDYDDSEMDDLVESKDFSCTQNLTFLCRNDKIDCTLYMRANDLIFGASSINFYEFSVMQEILAKMLGKGVGNFYYFVNSLHVYENHMPKVEKIIENGKSAYFQDDLLNKNIKPFEFPYVLHDYQATMKIYETTYQELGHRCRENYFHIPDTCVNDMVKICALYLKYLKNKNDEVLNEFLRIVPMSDLKLSCVHWLMKDLKLMKSEESLDIVLKTYKM